MTAPNGYDPSDYPAIAVTVDIVVFTMAHGELHVLLVRRGNDPYKGAWALPGGFVEPDEDLPEAAARELAEETGIASPIPELKQLGAYGKPGRDPRMRVVTIAFWTIQSESAEPTEGSDAASAQLVPVKRALAQPDQLAFDHHQILSDALEQSRISIGSGS